MSTRALALLGSGEFEPWSAEVDRWLLDRSDGDGSVVICPTASAPEGEAVFDAWGQKALAHFTRTGVAATVLPLRTGADAERTDLVSSLLRASLVYFSGGNPYYLAETLRDTPFLAAMLGRLDAGLAYAGCSAGAACLTERTFDSASRGSGNPFKPGLGIIRPGIAIAPHWDMVDRWMPGARDAMVAMLPPGGILIGIDEDTALCGDGSEWHVAGRQAVHLWREGGWSRYATGESLVLSIFGAEPALEG